MRVLGIETSCDETAVALVDNDQGALRVVTSLVSSQIDIHAKYGGIVPEVAARRHVDALFPLLEEAGIPHDGAGIDAIAVTAGPGLVPALRVGVEAAKALAWAWKKPLVGVNHLEGHLYSAWFSTPTPAFPSLALLVSGGHTELIFMKDHGRYELVGATRDDAAGEAFDKAGKLLGLPYPGGPKIDKLALDGDPSAIAFPRPMMESKDFDFSFSGLKTAVAVYVKQGGLGGQGLARVEDICASFQEAVVDVLVTKTIAAATRYRPASVLLSGGVAANKALQKELKAQSYKLKANFLVAPAKYNTDNAVMIGVAGYMAYLRKKKFKIEAQGNLSI